MSIKTFELLTGKAALNTLIDEDIQARDTGLIELMDKVINNTQTVFQRVFTGA